MFYTDHQSQLKNTFCVVPPDVWPLCIFFSSCFPLFFSQKYGPTDIFIKGFTDDLTSVESSYKTSINKSYYLTLQHNDRREKFPVGNSVSFLPRDKYDIFNFPVERLTQRGREKIQIRTKCTALFTKHTERASITLSEWHCCRSLTLGSGQSTVFNNALYFNRHIFHNALKIEWSCWKLFEEIHKNIWFFSLIIPLDPVSTLKLSWLHLLNL